VLERIENEASKPDSVFLRQVNDRRELKDIISNSEPTVRELHAIVFRFKSLGSSRGKNWDKLRLGVKNLDPLWLKLNQHTAAITAYLEAVGLGTLGRIERDLNAIPERIQHTIDALAAEIRAGRREGSITTTYSDDEKDVWKQFRRELIGDGEKHVASEGCCIRELSTCSSRYIFSFTNAVRNTTGNLPVNSPKWSLS
jgi:hypothetical protein